MAKALGCNIGFVGSSLSISDSFVLKDLFRVCHNMTFKAIK